MTLYQYTCETCGRVISTSDDTGAPAGWLLVATDDENLDYCGWVCLAVGAGAKAALAMPAATAMVVALVYLAPSMIQSITRRRLAPSMIDWITRRRRMAAATRMAEDGAA